MERRTLIAFKGTWPEVIWMLDKIGNITLEELEKYERLGGIL